jgi:hypothetical protein
LFEGQKGVEEAAGSSLQGEKTITRNDDEPHPFKTRKVLHLQPTGGT